MQINFYINLFRCIFDINKNLIFQVPVKDREYLKDQRGKIGPKGSFQLGPEDQSAIKKCKKEREGSRKKFTFITKSFNIKSPG